MSNFKNFLISKARSIEKNIVQCAVEKHLLNSLLRKGFTDSGIKATVVVDALWTLWYQNDETGTPPHVDRNNTPIDKFKVRIIGQSPHVVIATGLLIAAGERTLPTLMDMYKNAEASGWNTALEHRQSLNANWWLSDSGRNNGSEQLNAQPPFYYIAERGVGASS